MKELVLLVAVIVGCSANACLAQKDFEETGPVGIFDSRSQYDEFMGGAKRVAYGENGSAELQAMIPILNDMALNQPFGTTAGQYNTQVSELGLMANAKVREEIGMVDEQFEEFQSMSKEIQARAAERIRGIDFGNRDGLAAQIREIQNASRKDLESLFIPEQLERLRQLRNQTRLRNGRNSLVDFLTSNPVKEELEITKRQVDDLRAAEAAVELEIQEEIARLRERAKERILSRLESEQRTKVEKMFGETFAFSANPQNKKEPRESKRLERK